MISAAVQAADPAAALQALAQAERRAGLGGREAGDPYRRRGAWLVRESLLGAMLRRRLGHAGDPIAVPHLGSSSIAQLLRARFRGARIELPLAADAIFFKTNLRAFYLGATPVSLKLLGAVRDAAGFRTDVEMRRALAECRVLDVPRVRQADLDGAPAWVEEDLVSGRELRPGRDRDLILGAVLPAVWGMYRHFGITAEPCSAHYELASVAARLKRLRLPDAERERCRAIAQRIEILRGCEGAAVLVGLGHGDLSVGNVILQPSGRICFVDWELARRMPLASDLRKLLRVSGMVDAVVRKLAAEGAAHGDTGLLPPRLQCLVAVGAWLSRADELFAAARAAPGGERAVRRRLLRIRRDLAVADELMRA